MMLMDHMEHFNTVTDSQYEQSIVLNIITTEFITDDTRLSLLFRYRS